MHVTVATRQKKNRPPNFPPFRSDSIRIPTHSISGVASHCFYLSFTILLPCFSGIFFHFTLFFPCLFHFAICFSVLSDSHYGHPVSLPLRPNSVACAYIATPANIMLDCGASLQSRKVRGLLLGPGMPRLPHDLRSDATLQFDARRVTPQALTLESPRLSKNFNAVHAARVIPNRGCAHLS